MYTCCTFIRYCLDNGGNLLTIDDKEMNDWVKQWMGAQGIDSVGLGLRRNLDLPAEIRGGRCLEFHYMHYKNLETNNFQMPFLSLIPVPVRNN